MGICGGVISRLTNSHLNVNEPADNEFYDYLMNLCIPQSAENFNEEYENMALEFLRQYENSNDSFPINGSAVEEIVNGNFTVEEIECAIDTLKTNKSPGNSSNSSKCVNVFSLGLLPLFSITWSNKEIFQMPGLVGSVPLYLNPENEVL